MLRVLTSLFAVRPRTNQGPVARLAEAVPERPLAPMIPLAPPPADNDDGLAPLRAEIEHGLRRAGYLH